VGIILADLRQMFAFGQVRDLLPADPTFGLKKAAWRGQAQERDRILSDPEIIQLRHALLTSDLIEESQHGIWIMLGTLARVGELTKAQWSHLDLNASTWIIPVENSKNGIEHLINLSEFAREHFVLLLKKANAIALKENRKMSAYVFPARHHQGYVCVKTMTKQIGDRQRDNDKPMSRRSSQTAALLLPGGKWTPHDLRRTGATIMGNLGIRPDIIEKCLNHVEQNRMKRIYQRQELRNEMVAAWSALGNHLKETLKKSQPL
jgi:integrase